MPHKYDKKEQLAQKGERAFDTTSKTGRVETSRSTTHGERNEMRYKSEKDRYLNDLDRSLSARLAMLAGGSVGRKLVTARIAVGLMVIVSVILLLVAVKESRRADRLYLHNCHRPS